MKKLLTSLLCLVSSILIAPPATAQFGTPVDQAEITLIREVSEAAPGQPFQVAIEINHPGDWHSYYLNAGGPNSPLEFKLKLPEGYTSSEIQWPVPHVKWAYKELSYTYGNKAYFLTTITPPTNAEIGSTFTISSDTTIQMCNATGCNFPETLAATLKVKISENPVTNEASSEIFTKAKSLLPTVSEDWKFSAAQSERNLILHIQTSADLTKIEKPIFITDVNITDPKKAHTLEKTADGYKLTAPLREDQNVPANLTGIFTNETGSISDGIHGIKVSATTDNPVAEKSDITPSPDKTNIEKSNEEIAKELAVKYDLDSKISIITLNRIDDNGNAIDDVGNIIDKDDLFTDAEGNITDKEGNIIGKIEKTTFLFATLLIFAGGLILNLMPCVFPVLGVKVLGFVQLSGNDPKKIKMHGLVFTLGVLVSMWILAAVILTIRENSASGVAWGSQMKNPFFVGSMIILMAMFALNLYGVFEVGTSLTSAGGKLHAKKGYEGSFFSGILTTLIATPCGAPLLATAMTYTLQQTVLLAMVLFTVFALGVAAPYLVLSFFPSLINKLPKPGNWMVTFKKSMAFPLLATVVFLLSAFIGQTGQDGIMLMLWSLVILATAAFIYGTWSPPFIAKGRRYTIGFGLSLLLTVYGGYLGYQAMNTAPGVKQKVAANPDDIHSWEDWKPALVDQTRAKGRIVWIDYTADW